MKKYIAYMIFALSVVIGFIAGIITKQAIAEENQLFNGAQLQQQVSQQIVPVQMQNAAQQQAPVNNFYINPQPQQSQQVIGYPNQQLTSGGKIEVVQQKSPSNYVVDNVTSEQEEKDRKYEKSRFGITIGYAKQNYTGEYKDEARFFQNLNGSTKEKRIENREVDATHSINIGIFYDKIANIYALINPFIGLEANINIPVSLQNDYDFRKADEQGTKYYTEKETVGYLASNVLSNFIDVKARIGNIFRFGENFSISIYANAGFASALYGGISGYYRGGYSNSSYGYSYIFNAKDDPEFEVSFLAGYTYGAGVDIVIAKHYLIGGFYEVKKMLAGTGEDTYAIKHLGEYRGEGDVLYNPVSNYENKTIGIRIGLVF